jgi:hypothetical protein
MNISIKDILQDKKKLTIVLVALALVAIIIWAIVDITSRSLPKTTVEVHVVPMSASVKIDSKEYDTNSIQSISPGQHSVVISKDGFIEYLVEITVNSGENYQLSYVMKDKNDSYDYLKDSPDDEQLATAIGDTYWQNYEKQLSEQAAEEGPGGLIWAGFSTLTSTYSSKFTANTKTLIQQYAENNQIRLSHVTVVENSLAERVENERQDNMTTYVEFKFTINDDPQELTLSVISTLKATTGKVLDASGGVSAERLYEVYY